MHTSKKSKPITTSVPSFAIRFHASGEELEEIYQSEEEEKSEKSEDKSEKVPEKSENVQTGESNKHESSPMRDYLNKFGKRSSSIDTGINETSLNKESSDPWRIFSDIKGKLTKTVEEKLSEIKSKSNEGDNSPKHSQKKQSNSKETSNVSDSEEQSVSECSIPKSNLSTAEELEMSSDDETSLAESEKTPTEIKDFSEHKKPSLRQRIKTKTFVQFSKENSEGDSHVKISSLSTVLEKEGSMAEDDVESGVEACEELDDGIRISEYKGVTMIAPVGFVDFRDTKRRKIGRIRSSYTIPITFLFISFCLYFEVPRFLLGYLIGSLITLGCCYLYYTLKLTDLEYDKNKRRKTLPGLDVPILEVPAVKEYQPMTKFEGWMNEYPDHYDPRTYHIMNTQSVFLKLEGSVLRISHTRAKIPKRAMWDEPKHRVTFTHHRMYNLKGSQIMLLPTGLIQKRLWSKKYPICIILNKEKMNLELNIERKEDEIDEKMSNTNNENLEINSEFSEDSPQSEEPNQHILSFSQHLDEEKDIVSESFSDAIMEEDNDITAEDWDTLTLDESGVIETKIYLFARTCRDKEEWFRRLVKSTYDPLTDLEKIEDDVSTPISQPGEPLDSNSSQLTSETVESSSNETAPKKKTPEEEEEEYCRFMAKYNQVHTHHEKLHARKIRLKLFRSRKKKSSPTDDETEETDDISHDPNLWMNSFIARIIYDLRRHNQVIEKFQNLIQKKISTIKLPYFIDSILLSSLSMSSTSPTITHIHPPSLDAKGLWINLDIIYSGIISLAIVTKLNLMKLKEQAGKLESEGAERGLEDEGRSPIFHSDVEDSAESSDEEVWGVQLGDSQNSAPRKPNTGGKKFLQMVDKIASSKYFQQATENKYIKRAMEGVSKTEIKLTVEIRHLAGTLALNIPPPPSDRIWIGFQGNPELQLSAVPTFGERSINFMHVSRWIEKKLAAEFQKFLVLPNMEDFVLPMLIPTLPHP